MTILLPPVSADDPMASEVFACESRAFWEVDPEWMVAQGLPVIAGVRRFVCEHAVEVD